MLVFLLLSTFLLHAVMSIENDVEELTNNLFENLRRDPHLLGDAELSETSKAFIDKQVENYMNLMLSLRESEYSRFKRSLPENETSSEDNFVDIKSYNSISTKSPKDLQLFQQNGEWYALCLEGDFEKKFAHTLIIKKFQDNTLKKVADTSISHGVRASVFPIKSSTFIVVAENKTDSQNYGDQTSIFEFTADEQLKTVHKINTSYSTDVKIWEMDNNIYMSVAQFMQQSKNEIRLEVNSPIYKWCGSHFDIIQNVKNVGAVKIMPFSIQGAHFLAIANSVSDAEHEKVYSEILKYDLQTEKYELFQRILTHGCSDIKHIELNSNKEEHHYLVIANTRHRDFYGNNNGSLSIIYKFVEDYFLPFQSIRSDYITEWEPVRVEGGDVLLLATSVSDGLKCFQYDGWHFVESKIEFRNEVTSRGIAAMHSYKFQDKTIVVIANQNDDGTMTNMFEINLSPKNKLERTYHAMLSWCIDNEKAVEDYSDVEILRSSSRGDMEVDAASLQQEDDMEAIVNKIKEYESVLDRVEDQIQKSLFSEGTHVLKSNITANKILLKNDAVLNSPQIEFLNDISINSTLENLLNINEGFEIQSIMKFNSLRAEEPISLSEINGISADKILHVNDGFHADKLIINGSAIFLGKENKVDSINNVTLDKKVVLLNNGDQNFESLHVRNVFIEDLETPQINEFELASVEELPQERKKIKQLKELRAKKVVIEGFINNVDLETLERHSLKISGDQTISKNYSFDSIAADNLQTTTLSGTNISDLILITGGRYHINKDVKFSRDLSVNNLTALNYLDSIPVRDGRLDILEKDSAERQYVSGTKSFENLELSNPIRLRGKIRSEDLDAMNPVVTIDSNLDLNGDIRITGEVIVEETIKADDMGAALGAGSLRRARHEGLKLTDAEIPTHLRFLQHVEVVEVFADSINDVDPATWIVNGARHPQRVVGRKEFRGNLEVSGDTEVFKANGIDMGELETNVLLQGGDQVVSGKHYVQMAAAEKRIITKNLKFGSHPWTTVITNGTDQVIDGTTTFTSNLVSNKTTAKKLQTTGLLNNVNISEVIADAVTTDNSFKIFSHKTFSNLTVDNLAIKSSDIHNQIVYMENNDLHLNGNLIILDKPVQVKNINFTGNCNGLPKKRFELFPRDDNGVYEIEGDQEFDKIIIYGTVYVQSDSISNVSFSDFVNNTVKVDEPFNFRRASFNDIVVDETIELRGHVESLDLENIFEPNKTEMQIIPDEKVFQGDVLVEGKINVDGLLNGYNISDICGYILPAGSRKSLIIEGNVTFTKGPHVHTFNGHNVTSLENDVWFNDKPTVLNGNIEFNDVTFHSNVTVTGLINDISLKVISTNYLSKSRDQTVTASMTFEDVLFEDDISTPSIKLEGDVNGINVNEFTQNILMHQEQLFENALFFENVMAIHVDGEFTVNKMNLENEVMRYDKPNQVTGFKRFENLLIDDLTNDRNMTIQNVDILHWLKNSVLNEGTFRISGKKYFRNVTMDKGVNLKGLLNGREFNEDAVMLKNVPQDVSGRKTFIGDGSDEIKFKALKVKGLVNNVDIAERAHNQLLKTGHNVLKSEVHFHNKLTAKNVEMKKLCQGVNVTQLLKNISTLGALNNFEESYKGLLRMSDKVETSLRGQAYFLHYFKPVTYIPNANRIFASRAGEEGSVMAFRFENGSNILNFFRWDEAYNLFVDTTGLSIDLGPPPFYINKVTFREKDYIYIENVVEPSYNQGYTHNGKLIYFEPNSTAITHHAFYTNGTIFITSFECPVFRQYCLLFIYNDYQIDIVCNNGGEFYSVQKIFNEKARTASVMHIHDSTFLITMNEGGNNEQSSVTVWKLNHEISLFEYHQMIYEEEPTTGLTAISHNCGHYLAVAYGHLQKTMHLGRVSIRRFDERTQEFTHWQHIDLKTPTYIEFTTLPSEELALYILSQNPTEPLHVYMYEGISGFSEKIVGSAIPPIINMNQFSINNRHFVVAEHYNDISVIQAVFKGEKLH